MTLWSVQDAMSGTTVAERNQPHTGGSKKMKKPLGTASISCEWGFYQQVDCVCIHTRRVADLDQNKLVEQYSSPHVRKSDATHDYQGTDHEALGPCFESQSSRVRRLLLLSDCCGHHFDGVDVMLWGCRGPWMWKYGIECQTTSILRTLKSSRSQSRPRVLCLVKPLRAGDDPTPRTLYIVGT